MLSSMVGLKRKAKKLVLIVEIAMFVECPCYGTRDNMMRDFTTNNGCVYYLLQRTDDSFR